MTVRRPELVSAEEGAGLLTAGLTAYLALNRLKPDSQKNILVTAASGGVGHYAVQLAKLGNAHVTATCGARNLGPVAGLGSDEVLDYKTAEGASLRSPSGRKYDGVILCGPKPVPWRVLEENLAEDGVVIDLTPGPAAVWTYIVHKVRGSKKKLFPMISNPKGDESMKYLVGLMNERKMKTIIDSKYGLSEAEEGWRNGMSGHATGKIIVEH